MTRRRFLRRGLFGGALLLVGAGTGLALWPTTRRHQPARPLKVLDERRFAVLAAVAARVVRAPGADPVAIAHGVDDVLDISLPEVKKDVGDLLGLLDNALAGLLLDGRPRTFTALDGEAQDAVLLTWSRSRLALRRSGYQALRKLTLASHYAQPSTWASVGYPGPPELAMPEAPAVQP